MSALRLNRIFGFALTLTAIGALTAATSNPAGNASTTPPKKIVPMAPKHFPPPSFSSVVNTAGSGHYANSFAGEVTDSSGRLTIYVVRQHDGAFMSALRQAASRDHYTDYRVVYVQHSLAQLDAVMSRIGNRLKELHAMGIRPAEWGPDPRSNKVLVQLKVYSGQAANKLRSLYGAQWVKINSTTNRVGWKFTSRTTDSPPFFGGDAIWYHSSSPPSTGFDCTSGFGFVGNKSGNTFAFGAGHCSEAGVAVYTHHANPIRIGSVSTDYLPASGHTGDDIESLSGNFSGHVWGDGSTVYNVIGKEFLGVGTAVTFDGATSGEVRSAIITRTNAEIPIDGRQIINLSVAHKAGANVCGGGDSGSPVMEHTSNASNVYAVGVQVAEQLLNGVLDPSTCAYEQINPILTLVNGTIETP